jgi:hypothetical protein
MRGEEGDGAMRARIGRARFEFCFLYGKGRRACMGMQPNDATGFFWLQCPPPL